jgi:putative NADH-flavin reductase
MRIVVFGASGRTGIEVVKQLVETGNEVTAFVRRKGSIPFQHQNLKVVTGNLSNQVQIREVLEGADAVVSALGGKSLTKRATEFTSGIDMLVTEMEKAGIDRLLYLSSLGVAESRNAIPQPLRFFIADIMLRIPFADHLANENRIKASRLSWTIFRPGGLTDGLKTENIKSGTEITPVKGNPTISRSSLAAFMIQKINDTRLIKHCVWLHESR